MDAEPNVRIFGIEDDLLAAAARRSERVADERVTQRRRGRASFQEPSIGRVHLFDFAVERTLGEKGASRVDLENFGHGNEGTEQNRVVSSLPPDYDDDPERWNSWTAPEDVHDIVAPELRGPVLDIGCGDGRLASLLAGDVAWVGVDSSPTQLRENSFRPVVLADMRALPFRDGAFAEVTHLWCLYHLDEPVAAIQEAHRVLRDGGRYYASTSARDSDPELVPEGYPPTSFDAEEAVALVADVFGQADGQRWDDAFFPLETRDEVRAYCRHNFIDLERVEDAPLPLWLTKRGVLVRAAR
jgi:SAM-dependent methyltransferase